MSSFWPDQVRDLDKSLHGNFLTVLVQFVASTVTILQVLSPFPVIRKISQRRSTGDFSHLPYSLAFFNSTLALGYGVHVGNTFLIMINTFCLFVNSIFVIIFQLHSPKRTILRIYSCFGILFASLLLGYAHVLGQQKGRIIMGAIQNVVTCCLYASPLATLETVIRSKSSESVPFLLVLMSLVSGTTWLLYGVLIQDVFVQFPSLVGCVLSFLLLSLFAIYPSSKVVIF